MHHDSLITYSTDIHEKAKSSAVHLVSVSPGGLILRISPGVSRDSHRVQPALAIRERGLHQRPHGFSEGCVAGGGEEVFLRGRTD